jgi:hypothetical protein
MLPKSNQYRQCISQSPNWLANEYLHTSNIAFISIITMRQSCQTSVNLCSMFVLVIQSHYSFLVNLIISQIGQVQPVSNLSGWRKRKSRGRMRKDGIDMKGNNVFWKVNFIAMPCPYCCLEPRSLLDHPESLCLHRFQ